MSEKRASLNMFLTSFSRIFIHFFVGFSFPFVLFFSAGCCRGAGASPKNFDESEEDTEGSLGQDLRPSLGC